MSASLPDPTKGSSLYLGRQDMDTTPSANRSARYAFHVSGAIALCVALVVAMWARHRWSDGIAERFGWPVPWILYVAAGLTVAFVVRLFVSGDFELDRFIFRDASMIPLSRSERFRAMALCGGIAGGAVAVSIALFTPVDPLRSWGSDLGDAPLLVVGMFAWIWCGGALMTQSWEDHHVVSERMRRQEDTSRWNAGWRKRIATSRKWIQPTGPLSSP